MIIREASFIDKPEVINLLIRSQLATGVPDPIVFPSQELGARLYAREAVKRYVATGADRIVGHAMIEKPNEDNIAKWRSALRHDMNDLLEMGGDFVDPNFSKQGIWTDLLRHRLRVIRHIGAIPVTATWSFNDHVKKVYLSHGAVAAGTQNTKNGDVDLFVFPN